MLQIFTVLETSCTLWATVKKATYVLPLLFFRKTALETGKRLSKI
jgi:hypothetical protein